MPTSSLESSNNTSILLEDSSSMREGIGEMGQEGRGVKRGDRGQERGDGSR